MSNNSVKCPVCGTGESKCSNSRDRAAGTVRRRECRHGHRFTTLEILVTEEDQGGTTLGKRNSYSVIHAKFTELEIAGLREAAALLATFAGKFKEPAQ